MGKGVWNKDGVYFAKPSRYNGVPVIATHRNPETGEIWIESIDDIDVGKHKVQTDCWVNGDSIEYVE